MPHSTTPQYQIDAFLESQADAELDHYLESLEDGLPVSMTRAERRAEYFDLFHE